MYGSDQLIKGLKDPVLAKCELSRKWQRISSKLPHDIGVQGSYWTTNIGDRSIGEVFLKHLSSDHRNVQLFSKNIESCNAPTSILGGGGVIHDFYGTEHLRRRIDFLDNGGMVIGVGVPGFQSSYSRNLVREGLSGIDLITVRDERSRQQLKQVYDGEIHTTACPALLHQSPDVRSTGRTGVNFLPWFDLESEKLVRYFDYESGIDREQAKAQYLTNIKRICNQLENPIFIPFHLNDEKFARENLNIDVYPYRFSVEETLDRVSSVDKMVTMRYHSLVFSIICQKPVLAINYDPKVESLADRASISSYRPHETIPLKFESISNRDEIRNKAMENFRLMGRYIDD
ncbi:polysaccharide pyruvyl transferase family protein [Halobacteria archaeon HArc-gm2]|nr:polysaccharide pyruvyl transferase family protein [Halobacteria archaeon HArc-gm2]